MKTILKLIVCIFVIYMLKNTVKYYYFVKNDFKKNIRIGVGILLDYSTSRNFTYIDFTFNGIDHQNVRGDLNIARKFSKLKGKSFPVVYSSNPKNKTTEMLIFKSDFKEYKLPYPDSLKWVEQED